MVLNGVDQHNHTATIADTIPAIEPAILIPVIAPTERLDPPLLPWESEDVEVGADAVLVEGDPQTTLLCALLSPAKD